MSHSFGPLVLLATAGLLLDRIIPLPGSEISVIEARRR
jgi:hypothetical protein